MAHTRAFNAFSRIVFDHAGIALTDDKRYLVETRLAGICHAQGCATISELFAKVQFNITDDLIQQIVEAMTTNETWWFRDPELFTMLKSTIWPRLLEDAKARGKNEISMWCAAASTGQEIYTLRMAWEESRLGATGARLRIYATDIDTQALARAQEGEYSQLEVGRGLPSLNLISWFVQDGTRWRVKPELKKDIIWERMNLMTVGMLPMTFDIVLCRNVMIYFDAKGKEKVVSAIARGMHQRALLFLGGTESLYGLNVPLRRNAIGKLFGYSLSDVSTWYTNPARK